MSDSVRPHRWQPTRLPRPWDSPGKNTGVGCHFLLQCMKVKSEVAQSLSRIRLLVTPWTAAHQALPSMGFSRQEYWSGVPLTGLINYTGEIIIGRAVFVIQRCAVNIWMYHSLRIQMGNAAFIAVAHLWNGGVNHSYHLGLWVSEVARSCLTHCNSMDCSLTRFFRPWDFPGKNTGVGCHFLLQEIFPTQDWTQVSRIVGRCFTVWATREDLGL